MEGLSSRINYAKAATIVEPFVVCKVEHLIGNVPSPTLFCIILVPFLVQFTPPFQLGTSKTSTF